MKILVLVKAVPVTTGGVDGEEKKIKELIPNPADLTALEEAVTLKEMLGATVTVATMGVESCASILRQCIARGADEAVLVTDPAFAGSDTNATARILAAMVMRMGGFDLVFCGRRSTDGETGQVGPELAAHLNYNFVGSCIYKEIRDSELFCTCSIDNGRQNLLCPLPAIVSFQYGINSPRLPSLSGLFKSNRAELLKMDRDTLGLTKEVCGQAGSPTIVKKTYRRPFQKRQALILENSQLTRAAEILMQKKESVYG